MLVVVVVVEVVVDVEVVVTKERTVILNTALLTTPLLSVTIAVISRSSVSSTGVPLISPLNMFIDKPIGKLNELIPKVNGPTPPTKLSNISKVGIAKLTIKFLFPVTVAAKATADNVKELDRPSVVPLAAPMSLTVMVYLVTGKAAVIVPVINPVVESNTRPLGSAGAIVY